jgi:hypothetical protein
MELKNILFMGQPAGATGSSTIISFLPILLVIGIIILVVYLYKRNNHRTHL